MVAIVEEEGLPDPAEVGLALLLQLDARPDSRVDEQIVPKAAAVGKALEEFDVRPRDSAADQLKQFLGGLAPKRGRIDTIALQALESAELQPASNRGGVSSEDAQQDFLVVAEEEKRFDPIPPIGPQPLQDLRGARPPKAVLRAVSVLSARSA